jgi:ribosomal protein L40E
MVTSEEIKRRLEAKRKGIKTPSQKEQGSPKSETSNEEIKRRLEARRMGIEPPSGEKESLEEDTCPHCETMNPPEAKFCVGCGETLKEEIPTSVSSKTVETGSLETPTTTSKGPLSSKQAEYKICPACKQKNKLEAKFCVICGNKFEKETVPGELLSSSKPTKENIIKYPSPEAQYEDTVGGKSEETRDIDREIPEIRATRHLQSQETEETTSIIEDQISTDREEPYTPPKSELTSAISEMNDMKNERVVPSVPSGKTETSGGLSKNVDPVEKIRKAKELLDMGAITQEEFEQIKNKYLEQI